MRPEVVSILADFCVAAFFAIAFLGFGIRFGIWRSVIRESRRCLRYLLWRVDHLNNSYRLRRVSECRALILEIRDFGFCGPSDDGDEQTSAILSARDLLIQLQTAAPQILSSRLSQVLCSFQIDMQDIFSAYDVFSRVRALIPDIENELGEAFSQEERKVNATAVAIPTPICVIVGRALGNHYYNHRLLEQLFYDAGAKGEVPLGNCVGKCTTWLKRLHTEVDNPLAVLGKVLQEFIEVDGPNKYGQNDDRLRICEILEKYGYAYKQGGLIEGAATTPAGVLLRNILEKRDLGGIRQEFERADKYTQNDPPAAVTAASSILEATFKVYIEENELVLPADQSILSLYKVARDHIGFGMPRDAEADIKKVLSGIASIVDGIGSLRTHVGSAHGRGSKNYRLSPRHARLAVHAAHSIVLFFIETWDERLRSGAESH